MILHSNGDEEWQSDRRSRGSQEAAATTEAPRGWRVHEDNIGTNASACRARRSESKLPRRLVVQVREGFMVDGCNSSKEQRLTPDIDPDVEKLGYAMY